MEQWSLGLLLTQVICALGHVTLTFPPARFPPLDFLDNARTPGPCGLPRPRNPKYTTLVAGEAVNVTWALAYPHKGGYRLSILDAEGSLIRYLTTSSTANPFTGSDQPLTEEQSLLLPETLKCDRCILRLERQGLEWGADYGFHTCADVNIVGRSDARVASASSACIGPGNFVAGRCVCDRLYSGSACQYKDDCVVNADCGVDGECRLLPSSRYPQSVCFCSQGYFGPRCEKRYTPTSADLSSGCFNYKFPEGTRAYPNLRQGVFNPDCYSKRESGGAKVYWRLVCDKTEVELVLEFPGQSWLGLGWRPTGTKADCRAFPALQAPNPQSYQPKGKLHPMDCIDMVIGSASGFYYRVQDHYTRDRSTPLPDADYGGEDSLTAAFGVQSNVSTIIMFRRPLKASDRADQDLDTPVFMVWAAGQGPGHLSHSPESGLPSGSSSQFYAEDVLKYHGNINRGVIGVVDIMNSAPKLQSALVLTACFIIAFCGF